MPQTIKMPRNYRQLSAAMQALAGRCDGAVREDGQGFNGRDAHFGHVLADTPVARWSPKMARIAYKMGLTYRGQLNRYGIDMSDIDEPGYEDLRNGGKPRERVTAFDAAISGGLVVLTSPSFPGHAAIAAIKSCPGRTFTKRPKPAWRVPMSAAPELLRAHADGHINAGPDVLERLRQALKDRAKAAADSHRIDADITVEGLGGELMPFQRAGVAYYAQAHKKNGTASGWIADEMGLGKTVQALAILQATKAYPAVIVVPASLKLNWQREAMKWLPMVRQIEVLSGRKPLPIDSGVGIVIINYDVLDAWQSTLINWGPKAIVLDESHYCKTGKAKRTKAARAIASSRTIEVRLLLSGTPVVNAPPELISQLQIAGRMNDLGGYRNFTGRYCIRCDWGGFQKGGKNLHELNAKMRSAGMFVRRLKADVLTELPSKRRSMVSIELKNRRRYELAQSKVAAKIAEARVARAMAARQGRQVPGWALAASVTGITELRKVAAECKMDGAMDWIRNMLATGEKLVIFAHHTEVVERISRDLNCPMIRGGVKTSERQAAVDRFQTDDSCRAIVLNLRAGGVGLTLTAASNVVFVESGWTPADNLQAEDRCHRIGQRDSVTAWYLLGDNTIDQWMSDLVAKKRQTVDAATEGDEDVQRSIVSELSDMLAELA